MRALSLIPRHTALVLIDLQHGIVNRPAAPHAPSDVVTCAARLATRFREKGALVVLVHVAFSADDRDRLKPLSDEQPAVSLPLPSNWSDFVPELGQTASDIVITKRQWGAFYGTELELQLRRRGIQTIVLGGISTNFGVESTARDAWERCYQLVFAEDAMSGPSAEAHHFATRTIFPRLGLVRSTEEVLAALQ